jgi:cytochrome c-type biogenesis protein
MFEWIQQVLDTTTPGLSVLPAALLLGFLGSVTSCCNFALVGAIAGYSSSLSEHGERKRILIAGLSFMLGTFIALAALGAVTGFIGKVAGESLGIYWQLFAGLIMVFLGLASLDLLPFSLPRFIATNNSNVTVKQRGFWSSMLYGLAVGGGATTCSMCCNPVLPAMLGYTTLQGGIAWGTAVLGMFAVGYSLPLALGLVGLGLGLGKLRSIAGKATPIVRIVAGMILIGVGFYLLATV